MFMTVLMMIGTTDTYKRICANVIRIMLLISVYLSLLIGNLLCRVAQNVSHQPNYN